MNDIQPRDPDPTAHLPRDSFTCPAVQYRRTNPVYCTLPERHRGPHIAGDGTLVRAVWT